VYDVPLLVEGTRHDEFDSVVVVHADRDERLRRLVELRGMSPEEANRRIDSQASDEERLAVADTVIDANGSLEDTLHAVDELWAQLHAV
jgi:dephospho-CoA kinase